MENGGRGVWRYHSLLPIDSPRVSLGEGDTPLFKCGGIRGFENLYLKEESRNPTSSFADRGSTVSVSAAIRLGAKAIACASDGDTGASVAAYSAKCGLDCTVFAPWDAESGKLLQTLVFGAHLRRVPGTYRNSLLECERACRSAGRQNLTIETNPYAIEGEKTTAIEVAEQMGWRAPEFFIVPVGTGTNLYAAWKAFRELHAADVIDSLPRMVAVQASACAPIVTAFRDGGKVRGVGPSESVASSIAVGDPINGEAALEALLESGGVGCSLEEEEIVDAVKLLGSREGVFAEPASAATVAAARSLLEDGTADPSDAIVCMITGSGLKVPDSIARNLRPRLAATWGDEGQNQVAPIGRTKMQVLEILDSGSSYGYSVWRQLETRFGERMSLQAVYQHLDQLKGIGLVEADPVGERRSRGRRRKYYNLSQGGRLLLRSLSTIRDGTPRG
jgi:threonine synthase